MTNQFPNLNIILRIIQPFMLNSIYATLTPPRRTSFTEILTFYQRFFKIEIFVYLIEINAVMGK